MVATHVGFVGAKEKFTAPLLDLSPFGLAVRTSRKVETGEVFRLGIRVGTDYFRAGAIVRAKRSGGFAVDFLSMTPMDRDLLRRLYMRLQITARAARSSHH